jgi:hypothetical protein
MDNRWRSLNTKNFDSDEAVEKFDEIIESGYQVRNAYIDLADMESMVVLFEPVKENHQQW